MQVKVVEKQGREVLYSCQLSDQESAYIFAKKMEDIGLEVEILSLSSAESLGDALGLPPEEKDHLATSIHEELSDHEGIEEGIKKD